MFAWLQWRPHEHPSDELPRTAAAAAGLMKADLIDHDGMTARACVAGAGFVVAVAVLAAVVAALFHLVRA